MSITVVDAELQEILELACEVAEVAAGIQRERYETTLHIDTKSAAIDLVTEVDRECERRIVAGIRAIRPDDAIVAEEGHGGDHDDARVRWLVDPLDGTTNFAHGFPRFCVSIGVERAGERAVAVVVDPLLRERFEAVRGHGAWLGERRLKVSSEDAIERALIATGFAYDVHRSGNDNLSALARVVKRARGIRRDGSAALDLSAVAAGRLDGYWEQKLSPWDVAAGLLLVEEAGGLVSDYDGGPAPRSGHQVVATNGAIHGDLLALIAG